MNVHTFEKSLLNVSYNRRYSENELTFTCFALIDGKYEPACLNKSTFILASVENALIED